MLHPDLFGGETPVVDLAVETCGTCAHCDTEFVCDAIGQDTDPDLPACHRWQPREDETEIVTMDEYARRIVAAEGKARLT